MRWLRARNPDVDLTCMAFACPCPHCRTPLNLRLVNAPVTNHWVVRAAYVLLDCAASLCAFQLAFEYAYVWDLHLLCYVIFVGAVYVNSVGRKENAVYDFRAFIHQSRTRFVAALLYVAVLNWLFWMAVASLLVGSMASFGERSPDVVWFCTAVFHFLCTLFAAVSEDWVWDNVFLTLTSDHEFIASATLPDTRPRRADCTGESDRN